MENCIFCKIARKESPAFILYEDKDFVAFLDINPIKRGHLLLIPKKHHDYVFNLNGPLYEKIFKVAKKAFDSPTKSD